MDKDIIIKEMDKFFKDLTIYAKSRTSGKLQSSIKYTIDNDNLIGIVEMEDYGTFQDLGVNGKKQNNQSPYSFKSKRPPIDSLSKWANSKGINVWVLQKSIFEKGIKPKNFLENPYLQKENELAEIMNLVFSEQIEKDIKKNF